MSNQHPLAAYIDAANLSNERFGRMVGLSRVSIHRIIAGKQTPSPESALAIVEATNGTVTLEDLIRRKTIQAAE